MVVGHRDIHIHFQRQTWNQLFYLLKINSGHSALQRGQGDDWLLCWPEAAWIATFPSRPADSPPPLSFFYPRCIGKGTTSKWDVPLRFELVGEVNFSSWTRLCQEEFQYCHEDIACSYLREPTALRMPTSGLPSQAKQRAWRSLFSPLP